MLYTNNTNQLAYFRSTNEVKYYFPIIPRVTEFKYI